MATEKTIKIQKNKILTYSVNKEGFKTVYGSTLVDENKDINVKLYNLSTPDQDGPYKLGDRLFEISSFVDYFTPSGTYDVDSLKYVSASQTTGTGLTDIQVVKGTSTASVSEETGTWLSKVERDLQITTNKGTSKTFIFTYNGTNWDVVVDSLEFPNQNKDDYGISFNGTPTSGDVITIIETQYNRFAFFVLDANYRNKANWGQNNISIMPKHYNQNDANSCIESATYYNQYIFNNTDLNNYPAFNYCKNLGTFILSNNIKINCLLPNGPEIQKIYNNRIRLDECDPIIQSGSTSNNLTDWTFSGVSSAETCLEMNSTNYIAFDKANLKLVVHGKGSGSAYASGIVPIFEVPVM